MYDVKKKFIHFKRTSVYDTMQHFCDVKAKIKRAFQISLITRKIRHFEKILKIKADTKDFAKN